MAEPLRVPMAAPSTIARRMMALFEGDTEAYGTHGEPEQKGLKWEIKSTAKTLRGKVDRARWEKHLSGEAPLGVITVRRDNTCVWGSIDVDDYANDLLGLIARVEQEKLPLMPCRSKSGGLHLFIFLTEGVPAATLQTALRNISSRLGVAGSEIFPKQTKVLTDRGDLGNWMVMPYFGHTYDGKLREQVGLRKTGAELTIEQFLGHSEEAKISPADLQQWMQVQVRQNSGKRATGTGVDPNKEPFEDGPVCLQILSKMGVAPGGQSNALLNMGVYYKRVDPAGWKAQLEIANREFLVPPGSAEGLLSVIRSLEKKDYNYTCKLEPLQSHCNSATCRLRKFGVGEENAFPQISGLSKLQTDPPLWFVDIDDVRLELQTDDLLYYQRFLKACFNHQKVFLMLSQNVWLKLLKPLMEDCTIIEVPNEVSRGGQFQELLEEFCTNRQRGKAKEDLLAGRPWEDEELGMHYFRLRDFQKFLSREGFKDITRGEITQKIKHLGGNVRFMKAKEKGFNAWWVPSDSFKGIAPIDLPKTEGEVI